MKWRIWKRPPEWKNISLYAVVILVSLFVCEFAFAARKAKGVTCVKDFIITYNYRVVPYIAIPVIMVLLISYFRRMYDDNRLKSQIYILYRTLITLQKHEKSTDIVRIISSASMHFLYLWNF